MCRKFKISALLLTIVPKSKYLLRLSHLYCHWAWVAWLNHVCQPHLVNIILYWLCGYWNSITLSNFEWEEYSYFIASSDLLYRPSSYSYMQLVRMKLTFRKNFNAIQMWVQNIFSRTQFELSNNSEYGKSRIFSSFKDFNKI